MVSIQFSRALSRLRKPFGFSAIHNWTFEARRIDTFAITEKPLSSWLTRRVKYFVLHFEEKSLEATLHWLKNKSEEK